MSWNPPDDFYPGYSLYKDLGYGPEGERNLTIKQLRENEIEVTDQNIKATLNLARNLMIFIKENCNEEVSEFSEFLREEIYVGAIIPLELILAKLIESIIFEIIFSIGKNIYKAIKDYIKKKIKEKQEKDIEKEMVIILKIIDKIENNSETIEILSYIKIISKDKEKK